MPCRLQPCTHAAKQHAMALLPCHRVCTPGRVRGQGPRACRVRLQKRKAQEGRHGVQAGRSLPRTLAVEARPARRARKQPRDGLKQRRGRRGLRQEQAAERVRLPGRGRAPAAGPRRRLEQGDRRGHQRRRSGAACTVSVQRWLLLDGYQPPVLPARLAARMADCGLLLGARTGCRDGCQQEVKSVVIAQPWALQLLGNCLAHWCMSLKGWQSVS
jgi:hypothetical protein